MKQTLKARWVYALLPPEPLGRDGTPCLSMPGEWWDASWPGERSMFTGIPCSPKNFLRAGAIAVRPALPRAPGPCGVFPVIVVVGSLDE